MASSSNELRQRLARARHVVVKMGTQLLTGPDGQLDPTTLQRIAAQVAILRERGVRVTLVSSGAIGAGMKHLGMSRRPRDVAELQAVAAVGQPQLMRMLREAFEPHQLKVAQLLLTRDDFDHRDRFLNLRNCVGVLHRLGSVPVVNENDTVAVEEIRLGDNDTLAALVCNALRAEALILLSVVDGLLDPDGHAIDLVENLRDASDFIRKDKSDLGTGGMVTKHSAAQIVTRAGELTIIANGRTDHVLTRLFDGEPLGTVFAPASKRMDSRHRWIGLTRRPAGTIHVDLGAAAALVEKGKSLLASGITRIEGEFEGGAVTLVLGPDGEPVARGLCNYSSDELGKIAGKKSNQFAKILGRPAFDEVIHRDNLVLA